MYTLSSSFLSGGSGTAGSVSVTTVFESVLYALVQGLADAGAIPVVLLLVC